jgi:hypothetical protein
MALACTGVPELAEKSIVIEPAQPLRPSTLCQYSGGPNMQEIVRQGRLYGYTVTTYCDDAARQLRTCFVLYSNTPKKELRSYHVTIMAYDKYSYMEKTPYGLLSLTSDTIKQQVKEQYPEIDDRNFDEILRQISRDIFEKFNLPIELKPRRVFCVGNNSGVETEVPVSFEITIPPDRNPATVSRDEIMRQIEARLRAERVQLPPEVDIENLAMAFRTDLCKTLKAEFTTRSVGNFFLPDYLAALNPARSAVENRAYSLKLFNIVMAAMDIRGAPVRAAIKELLEQVQDKNRHLALTSRFNKGLVPSDAKRFLEDLGLALQAELDRYDPASTTEIVKKIRADLATARDTVRRINPEDIMLARYIDTPWKVDRLIELLEEQKTNLAVPVATAETLASGADRVPLAEVVG